MITMTIGELARQTGVGIETIRFYERRGLLPCPARRLSGYRQFGPDAIARIQFIRRSQAVGFTLKEIEALLQLRDDASATKAEVREQVRHKIEDIDVKIRELKRMRKDLQQLLANCHDDGTTDDCSILHALHETPPTKDAHHGH